MDPSCTLQDSGFFKKTLPRPASWSNNICRPAGNFSHSTILELTLESVNAISLLSSIIILTIWHSLVDASRPGCVARRSNTLGILASRALRYGRLHHLCASLYLCPEPLRYLNKTRRQLADIKDASVSSCLFRSARQVSTFANSSFSLPRGPF